jgi:hypothetical protein
MREKPGFPDPFSRFLENLAERMNGWLTSEDSNLHIPD